MGGGGLVGGRSLQDKKRGGGAGAAGKGKGSAKQKGNKDKTKKKKKKGKDDSGSGVRLTPIIWAESGGGVWMFLLLVLIHQFASGSPCPFSPSMQSMLEVGAPGAPGGDEGAPSKLNTATKAVAGVVKAGDPSICVACLRADARLSFAVVWSSSRP